MVGIYHIMCHMVGIINITLVSHDHVVGSICITLVSHDHMVGNMWVTHWYHMIITWKAISVNDKEHKCLEKIKQLFYIHMITALIYTNKSFITISNVQCMVVHQSYCFAL